MCGIVGYAGSNDCVPFLLEGLRRLEYRGYDSAGIAVQGEGRTIIRRRKGKLSHLVEACRVRPCAGTLGIAHTRWATHGAPSEANAHPHRAGEVSVVHNGIIENHVELRAQLERSGRVFSSETDTEVIAHLIDHYLTLPSPDPRHPLHVAVRRAMAQVRGSFAVLVISDLYPGLCVATRRASPLVLAVNDGEVFASSDTTAVLSKARDVIFLADDELAILRRDGTLSLHDQHDQPITPSTVFIDWDPESAEKQGYDHFMLKEIFEQPQRILDTFRGRLNSEDGKVVLEGLDALQEKLAGIDHVQILACGTSYHAGLIGRRLIEQLAGVRTTVDLASEYRYAEPLTSARTLTVAISQSGETADTLAAGTLAKELGSTLVAICNVLGSSLSRCADGVIYTHAGPEIGVASTKAFTTQLVALLLLAAWLGQQRGTWSTVEGKQLARDLEALPQKIERMLADLTPYKVIAERFDNAASALFLGRGHDHALALEGALKLKEISYVHAEGYAAGEMKHGPIALIDENLPVVVLATRSRHYEKVVSNLEEVRSRGGRIIVIAEAGDAVAARAEATLTVPAVDALLSPIVNTIPLQLLAYFVADRFGTDIDQPRNLAKSVTVE